MFTKLYSSIIYSSVWQEPDETRLVWITLLALSDRHGMVYGSVLGLAAAARVSLPECEKALETFMSPDEHSSNPDNEGRRVERVPGGWKLLNYALYRGIGTSESRREYQRQWQAKRRKLKKQSGSVTRNEQQFSAALERGDVPEADRIVAMGLPGEAAKADQTAQVGLPGEGQ